MKIPDSSLGKVQNDKKGCCFGIRKRVALFPFYIWRVKNWLHNYLLGIDQLRVLLLEWGFSRRGEIWLVLILLVASPILEEIYWRGYIFDKLRKAGTARYTILMTTEFYTLYHLLSVIPIFEGIYGMMAAVPVFIAGMFWSFIRQKTGSITESIIGYVFSDIGIIWFQVKRVQIIKIHK